MTNWIRHFDHNRKGRDFVVGDIHGCFDELILLLAHTNFNPKRDRLFSVGDLVDRGRRSASCLELLRKPWFFTVRGNHEQMLLDHWSAPGKNPAFDPEWLSDLTTDEINAWGAAISDLPHVIRVGRGSGSFYVVHAEIWENGSLLTDEMIDEMLFANEQQAKIKALWSRSMLISHSRPDPVPHHSPAMSPIFCGHSIVPRPLMLESAVYIDTGAFAPYLEMQHAGEISNFGLSLVEPASMSHWFAPTSPALRGSVFSMGTITEQHDRISLSEEIMALSGSDAEGDSHSDL